MSSNSTSNKDLSKIDWSFTSINNSGLHSLHWYPATFLAAIPGTIIPSLTKPGATILDAFCGSGTSGLEAVRLNRKFIGFDINPNAILISEAKLVFPEIRSFKIAIEKIIEEAQYFRSNEIIESHPQFEELRGWYHPETLSELASILHCISSIKNEKLKKCALAVFSGILKNTSSQHRHWGWVCDNVKPKTSEIVYKDAITTYLKYSNDFADASEKAFRDCQINAEKQTRTSIRKLSKLTQGDCVTLLGALESDSVDLMVTSPPYYGVTDYIKSQRLSFLWFDSDDLEFLQLGFRNFQKLRASEAGSRAFRHRSTSRDEYLKFMSNFFIASRRVIKSGSHLALVVGESKARKAITEDLIKSTEDAGFKIIMNTKRDIKATRRRLLAKVEAELVLLFQ